MLVHLFGTTSSPSCANFSLRQTADNNQDTFSKEVIDTVRRNFYVDDCLKSVRNEVEAVQLIDPREMISLQTQKKEVLFAMNCMVVKYFSHSMSGCYILTCLGCMALLESFHDTH